MNRILTSDDKLLIITLLSSRLFSTLYFAYSIKRFRQPFYRSKHHGVGRALLKKKFAEWEGGRASLKSIFSILPLLVSISMFQNRSIQAKKRIERPAVPLCVMSLRSVNWRRLCSISTFNFGHQ